MSGFNPNHVSKGVPFAGRFTHAAHTEATVSLSGSSTLTADRTAPATQAQPQASTESADQLAAIPQSRMLDSVRAAEQVFPMERALAAYASRTVKNGTWEDYLPVLHDRLPDHTELLTAMRAFKEAPTRLANTPLFQQLRPPSLSPSPNPARLLTFPPPRVLDAQKAT